MNSKYLHFFLVILVSVNIISAPGCKKTEVPQLDYRLIYAAKYVPHMAGSRTWHCTRHVYWPTDTTIVLADTMGAITVINDTTIRISLTNIGLHLISANESVISFSGVHYYAGQHIDETWYVTYFVAGNSMKFVDIIGEAYATTYTYTTL